MIANKLNVGDEIRVIAPSRSLSIVKQADFDKALKFLSDKGFVISFSKNSREIDETILQVYNLVLETYTVHFLIKM